jgi:hypothetical protein
VDRIFDQSDNTVAYMDLSGEITDLSHNKLGSVTAWGDVQNADDFHIGDVDSRGYVTTLSENNKWVGTVNGQRVYTPYDRYLGRVEAKDYGYYSRGITDAHKAGAALVLLVLGIR